MIRNLRRQHYRWAITLVTAVPAIAAATATTWHRHPTIVHSDGPQPSDIPRAAVDTVVHAGPIVITIGRGADGLLVEIATTSHIVGPDPLVYWTADTLGAAPDSSALFLGSTTAVPIGITRRPRNGTVGIWDNAHRVWLGRYPWPLAADWATE